MRLKIFGIILLFSSFSLACQTNKDNPYHIIDIENYDYQVYVKDTIFYKNQFQTFKQIIPEVKNSLLDSILIKSIDKNKLFLDAQEQEFFAITTAFDYLGHIKQMSFIIKIGSNLTIDDLLKVEENLISDNFTIFDFEYIGELSPRTDYITRIRIPLSRFSNRN